MIAILSFICANIRNILGGLLNYAHNIISTYGWLHMRFVHTDLLKQKACRHRAQLYNWCTWCCMGSAQWLCWIHSINTGKVAFSKSLPQLPLSVRQLNILMSGITISIWYVMFQSVTYLKLVFWIFCATSLGIHPKQHKWT